MGSHTFTVLRKKARAALKEEKRTVEIDDAAEKVFNKMHAEVLADLKAEEKDEVYIGEMMQVLGKMYGDFAVVLRYVVEYKKLVNDNRKEAEKMGGDMLGLAQLMAKEAEFFKDKDLDKIHAILSRLDKDDVLLDRLLKRLIETLAFEEALRGKIKVALADGIALTDMIRTDLAKLGQLFQEALPPGGPPVPPRPSPRP